MLIKVTNQCAAACSHCTEDSRPKTRQHMTMTTFRAALDCSARVEELAREQLGYNVVLLSGGECTEHPDILELIEVVEGQGLTPFLLTNGWWLGDSPMRVAILKPGRKVLVQVTNDARFYPKKLPAYEPDDRILPTTTIGTLLPIGRAAGRVEKIGGMPKQAPSSFNFRSFVHNFKDIREAVLHLRVAALAGRGWGNCAPSISHDGSFMAGESRLCAKIGDVDSTVDELTAGVLAMGSCDRCGLERNLGSHYRQAIGLPVTAST